MADKKQTGSAKDYPKSAKYKGRTIKFSTLKVQAMASQKGKSAGAPAVERTILAEIDDKKFEIQEMRDGVFGSILLPYGLYTSPVDIAQKVIDHVPAYRK